MQGSEASAGATTKVNIQVAKNKDGMSLSSTRAQAQLQGCKGCKKVIHRSAMVGQMHTSDARRLRERRDAHSATQMGMPNMTIAPCIKAIGIKPKSDRTETAIRFGHQDGQAVKLQHGDSISCAFIAGDGPSHFLERNNVQVQLKIMQSSYCQFQWFTLDVPSSKLQQLWFSSSQGETGSPSAGTLGGLAW